MLVIKNEKLRSCLRIAVPFILMPAVIAMGIVIFDEKRYALITLAAALLSVVLFISGFDRKKIGTRRLVIVSIMVALSAVGRFIPLFKPVTALTILTGIYLGGESGFLTGAMTAVISNFYFGQGPWTPFQMLAWGLIGLAAGYLSKPLRRSRALLLVFGAFSGVLFSFIMDVWTVLWYSGTFDIRLYLASLVTAIPHTMVYAVSNVLFLILFARPFGEKLDRIQRKYGL